MQMSDTARETGRSGSVNGHGGRENQESAVSGAVIPVRRATAVYGSFRDDHKLFLSSRRQIDQSNLK